MVGALCPSGAGLLRDRQTAGVTAVTDFGLHQRIFAEVGPQVCLQEEPRGALGAQVGPGATQVGVHVCRDQLAVQVDECLVVQLFDLFLHELSWVRIALVCPVLLLEVPAEVSELLDDWDLRVFSHVISLVWPQLAWVERFTIVRIWR